MASLKRSRYIYILFVDFSFSNSSASCPFASVGFDFVCAFLSLAIFTSAEEGGYVFGSVCLSVCLSVHPITRKLVNRF